MEQKNFEFNETSYNGNTTMNSYGATDMNSCGCNMDYMEHSLMCNPIQECPQERVCHRYMCYEVPQVCPFM